jgi:DNA-binding SARP family transcriptional activator
MAMLEIFAFGGLTIRLNGEDITERLPAKAAALLVFMARESGRLLAKEKLISYLWEDSDLQAARYNLRHTLWIVKKILADVDDEILHVAKDFCGIVALDTVYTDFGDFAQSHANIQENEAEQLEKLKALYRGDFLDGVYLRKCVEFNDWIFYERESFQEKYFDVLHRLKDYYFATGNYLKRIELLTEMLQINPLKEDLYIEQIRTYIMLEDWEKAHAKYMACTDMLRNELNESPGDVLTEIGQRIKARKRIVPLRERRQIVMHLASYPGPEYLLPAHVAEVVLDELSLREKTECEGILNDFACLTARWQPRCPISFRPEDVRLYSSIFESLVFLSKRATIQLLVENVEALDARSAEFLAFLEHRTRACDSIEVRCS